MKKDIVETERVSEEFITERWKRKSKFFVKLLDTIDNFGYNIHILNNNKHFGRNDNMATAKNYTDEMVAQMTEQYKANPLDCLKQHLSNTLGVKRS